MDMSHWQHINPCGLSIKMTQMRDLCQEKLNITVIANKCGDAFKKLLMTPLHNSTKFSNN